MSAVATLPRTSDVGAWTDAEKVVIEAAGLVFHHTYGDRVGQSELAPRPVVEKFLHVCRSTGLDPLTRQIYCIGRLSKGVVSWSIQTSIDGFRVTGERSQKYAGQDEAEWLTEAGDWVPVFVKALHGDHPLAARVRVYRKDWDKPATGIATWDEYAETKYGGGLTDMWARRGPGQLAKCAEALAFRKAFPQDLSGLYTNDEMGQALATETDAAPQGPETASEQPQAPRQQPNAPEQASTPTNERPQAQVTAEAVYASQEWVDRVVGAQTAAEVLTIYREGRLQGVLTQIVVVNDTPTELGKWIIATGEALKAAEVENGGPLAADGAPAATEG